ncbi:hypothetical protein TPHA_0P01040 [Tetrapisispora phaffii CBS 4417]|uniref:Mitochondrial presequence protease n=1 Tax=Tetrapisispora phaffii (strain ATCC 24235 / CBS 4417 / NBRC 1672 / NRRL Y-8282 / UCD 70-5) TaxID=1071381 RepID=G8C284_TETPH|nr:hypothetical protein TPHA_0P01040 [Tetrapisispora phaffii CBS 4417]CCE66262.1 hypothetical protein TPHA_0P01040 [Tetrapisispora phaffii CBS 4417]
MTWKKLVSFQLEYAPQYKITKYVSEESHLQLVHIDHKTSPLVQGYFAVATECGNDSGVPHTLEHLIFMGSPKYPYKGLLDTVGNLCMSSTNAWTATDQTVYTLTSAGWTGFKKLLPMYLEHIINPTLTDDAYVTEVYHIDPDTLTDKGVVYSEMEAIETQNWFVTMLEKQRMMFPEGNGYRSETGGLTENLRNLTNEEIKQFHADYYKRENLCIIICGNLPEEELLATVSEWDNETMEPINSERPLMKRPFVESGISQIPQSRDEIVESVVEFPELDESQSELLFSWIGEPYDNYENDLATSILLDYLTETAIAPFNKILVEIEDPMANSVDYWTDDFSRTIINLSIHGVPTGRIDETKEKVLEIIKTHKIDLPRMKQMIDNGKWDYILRCEKNGDSVISQAVITDFIYGDKNGESLKRTLFDLSDFDAIFHWNEEKWQQLLNDIFINNKPVIVLGKPSKALYQLQEDRQSEIIIDREAECVADENRKPFLRKLLDKAILNNEKEIPSELFDRYTIEDPLNSVDLIETQGITLIDNFKDNGSDELTKNLLTLKPKDFPFFIHAEHFQSQFIEFHVLVNSWSVKDVELLPYFHIFNELFSLPMSLDDGSIMSYEEVITKLKNETVDSNISLGLQGSTTDLIDFRIRCKSLNYMEAVKWIKYCLYDMIFDEKRVGILLENYCNSIVELKREGDTMLESLKNRYIYNTRSMKKSVDALYVEDKLESILDDLEDGKFSSNILPKLEEMRKQLRENFANYQIIILGDISKILDNFFEPWNDLINEHKKHKPSDKRNNGIPEIPKHLELLTPLGNDLKQKAFIITTPASDSTYMSLVTKVKFNMDYSHPDYAAVSLASEYLQCVEGPFWKGIRGAGLAYGANMMGQTESNIWEFSIMRGTDIIKCFEIAKKIVNDYANNELNFEPKLLEGALSSIINRIATMESSYFSSAISKYIDQFLRKRGTDFNIKYLENLSNVGVDDLRYVTKKYLTNLFDVKNGAVFISCHPSKLEEIQKYLKANNYEIEVEELEDDEDDDNEEDEEDD